MEVGDIVQLSAAGKKMSANWRCRHEGGFGIIKEIKSRYNSRYCPYLVEWWSADMERNFPCRFKRYELKKFKPDKK